MSRDVSESIPQATGSETVCSICDGQLHRGIAADAAKFSGLHGVDATLPRIVFRAIPLNWLCRSPANSGDVLRRQFCVNWRTKMRPDLISLRTAKAVAFTILLFLGAG